MLKPLYIWAGGKTKMLPKYVNNPGIPLSGYKTYVEPFFGGGAMMCWINEHNPDITRYVINEFRFHVIYNISSNVGSMNIIQTLLDML